MDENTGISIDSLKSILEQSLKTRHCDVEDMSGGCGQAFSAIIVSPQFENKTTLARHRLVNNALKSEIKDIHAWTPKCYTPEQWEKQKQEGKEAVAPGKDTTGEVVEGVRE